MSFEVRACVLLVCDGGCDEAWDEYTPHFESEVEAFEHGQECGWHFSDGQAYCASCHARRVCAAEGHDWDEWRDEELHTVAHRQRYCDRCGRLDYDPPFDVLYPKFQALRDAEAIINEASK